MKTAVSIPDDLFALADETASELGVSRSQLYADALKGYLAHRESEVITERLNAVYATIDSSLDPGIMAAQVHILDEW
jgi:metal-responsive CopG/Arc/MetJ family transcriptional regulator